jgi:hypothetical protein
MLDSEASSGAELSSARASHVTTHSDNLLYIVDLYKNLYMFTFISFHFSQSFLLSVLKWDSTRNP